MNLHDISLVLQILSQEIFGPKQPTQTKCQENKVLRDIVVAIRRQLGGGCLSCLFCYFIWVGGLEYWNPIMKRFDALEASQSDWLFVIEIEVFGSLNSLGVVWLVMFDPFDTIGFITVTLPQTHSSHLKRCHSKRKAVFQPSGALPAFGSVNHH